MNGDVKQQSLTHDAIVINALLKISELVNQNSSPKVLYKKVHQTISEIMEIKNIAIALYDESKQIITFDYIVDEVDGNAFVGKSIPLGPSLTSYLIQSKQPQILSKQDITQLQKAGHIESTLGTISESWIGVPFIDNGSIYGALIVQSYESCTLYSNEDLKLLTFVAAHITNVIIHKLFYLDQQIVKQELQQKINLIEQQNSQLEMTMVQLKDTQKELVQKEKMASLGNLMAGVAHEINTPLGVCVTGITNLSHIHKEIEVLFQKDQLNAQGLTNFLEDVGDNCKIIESNCLRAAELINSFKKMAVDQSSSDVRSLDVRQYIVEVLHSLKPMFKALPHEVNIECEGIVVIDSVAGALAQVFTNLIQNTLTHAFQANKKGNITISIRKVGEEAEIIYRDDGLGMNKEQLKHLFEPFYTTKRNQGGSGLGAHLIYNLVTTTLQGKVSVKSKVNQGVVYTLLLPLTIK